MQPARTLIASIATLALISAWAPPGEAARRSTTCNPDGTRTLAVSERGRVFTRGRESFSPVVACLHRTGRRVRLGTQDCFDSRGVGLPRLAGPFVAYSLTMCHRTPISEAEVLVRNLRTGRVVRRLDATSPLPAGSTPLTAVTDLELKPNGAVAWIAQNAVSSATGSTPERVEVHKSDRDGEDVLLDSSLGIAPVSLARSRSTLYWTRDGSPFAATLR